MGLTKFIILAIAGYIGYGLIDRFNPSSIEGKRVVITGASTGIGEQIAYHYAKLGARVLITARREAVLQEVVARCKELGAKEAIYLPLDMGKDDTKRLIDEAREKFGGLDHLILNHVNNGYMELFTGDLEELKKTMQVNFHAYVSLATYATPMLAASKGNIGVVSAAGGKVGIPYAAGYGASKFALHGFFDALRQEYQMQNIDISVTLFVIGGVNTPNALEYTKFVVDSSMFSTSASSTAHRIMTGTANREREVFFPWHQTRPVTVLRDIAPWLLEQVIIQLSLKEQVPEGDETPKILQV